MTSILKFNNEKKEISEENNIIIVVSSENKKQDDEKKDKKKQKTKKEKSQSEKQHKEALKRAAKKYYEKTKDIKIKCTECDGEYTVHTKSIHMKSKKHHDAIRLKQLEKYEKIIQNMKDNINNIVIMPVK